MKYLKHILLIEDEENYDHEKINDHILVVEPEEYGKISDKQKEFIKNSIKKDCRTFFEYYKNNNIKRKLFRGSSFYDNILFSQATSPKNRQSKDTRKEINNEVDRILKENGAVALRTNSSFTSLSLLSAKGYNYSVRCIIPFDDSYFTMTSQNDMFDLFNSNISNFLYEPERSKTFFINLKEFYDYFKKINESNFFPLVRNIKNNLVYGKAWSNTNLRQSFEEFVSIDSEDIKNFLSENSINTYEDFIQYITKIDSKEFMKKISDSLVFGRGSDLVRLFQSEDFEDKYNYSEVYIHGNYYIITENLLHEIFEGK